MILIYYYYIFILRLKMAPKQGKVKSGKSGGDEKQKNKIAVLLGK